MMNSQFKRGSKHYENVKPYFIGRCICLFMLSSVYLRSWIIQRNGNDYFPIIRCGEYFRYRKESENEANEASRQARAQAKHDRKHKHARES